ncbi:zinc finger BED domain-containing protein 5-like [Onthophagus taurus]|uniref:zinc finger BED domain-containing protein 5-like n=1 Tax=Onthophagus taurus TaxID=166361 RepID=UPI0039BE4FB4
MDQWLKFGTLKKRKITGLVSDPPSSSTSPCEEQPKEKLPRVSQIKLPVPVLQPTKVRKYSEEYLSYGFSFTIIDSIPRPERVVCGEVLSNGSMKPSLLSRHLQTKHVDFKDKGLAFFKRLLENKNKSNIDTYLTSGCTNEDAVEASYRISYRIARNGKNHTIGENLILSSFKDAVVCMFGNEYVQKINAIPLSNDTVSRRIKEISANMEETLIKEINHSQYFSIQVDESTDVAQFAVLMVIARYLKGNEFVEGHLLCHLLSERTTGADIFHAIDSYFTRKGIKWSKCCGLCTDGGKSMSGCYSGLLGCVKAVAPLVQWTHCCIHRQALASKCLPTSMKDVLDDSSPKQMVARELPDLVVKKS